MIRTRMILCSLLKRQANALRQESARIYVAILTTPYGMYRHTHQVRELSRRAAVGLRDYRPCDASPLLHTRSKGADQYAFCGACKTAQTDQQRSAKCQAYAGIRTHGQRRQAITGRAEAEDMVTVLVDEPICPRPALI